MISGLLVGFASALSLNNLLYCFLGALLGTLVGVLPGIGPVATIAILLPVTFTLDPTTALIMLAGIYYGAQYGGSTSAILINMPGEATSVVTALDGHQLARQGQAGAALAVAAIGSFFAGTVSTFLIALFAPTLANFALVFGPAEYTSLMLFGLVGAIVLAQGSIVKAIGMVFLGMLLASIGTDISSGAIRFAMGVPELADGIGFIVLATGMFALAEVVTSLDPKEAREVTTVHRVTRLSLTRQQLRQSAPAIVRGTVLGSVLGILPGGGALLASFGSYVLEKRLAKDPSRFGKGAIEGVAAPEAANNAGAQVSFIPMLTLGLPSNPVMAMMMAALMIHNIPVGPTIMDTHPAMFWGLIASMWIGNLILLILNLPLVGLWARLLTVPYALLYPAILLFCCIGVYSVNSSAFDVILTTVAGIIGFALAKLRCELAPLLLGFILGPLLEQNLNLALQTSRGSFMIFVESPISLTLIVASLVVLASMLSPQLVARRADVFVE